MSIDLVTKLIDNYNLEDKHIGLILNSIISRLNFVPFPETCKKYNFLNNFFPNLAEELRIKLVDLLQRLLNKYTNELIPVMSDLSSMIAKLLTDAFPDIKNKLSEFLIQLSAKLNKVLGPHSKSIITSLCSNLKHAHNKIRKVTVLALVEVLLCEIAGKFFEETIPFMKLLSNDKNYDVRKAFYASVFRLLTNFNIIYLRKYEHNLVLFLMNGLSDEKEDVQVMCLDYLEQAGEYRKRLAEELEEDVGDINSQMQVDN